MTRKILMTILLSLPMVAWGDLNADLSKIRSWQDKVSANSISYLKADTLKAFENLEQQYISQNKDKESEIQNIINNTKKEINLSDTQPAQPTEQPAEAESAKSATNDSEPKTESTATPEELQAKVDEAQKKLDAAKEKEQSFANRMLGGLTTAATGIGGMQLAQGISEKMADSAADKDMDAYIATMRCAYADGQSVKFGAEFVLPGYSAEFIELKRQYNSIVTNLQTMKPMLGMAPGIESELIVQNTGLYDDENTGVASGAYASRYRAAAGSEKDEKGLSSASKEARNRMIAGGVVAGVGLVGGIVGNALINRNDDGSAKYDAFSNIQLANTDQAKRLINLVYNDTNQSNKVNLDSCEKKSNVVISGRSQDTYTCKYENSEEKIQFEFDDLSEPSSTTVQETLHEYFCVNKNSNNTTCNQKVNKVMYNK